MLKKLFKYEWKDVWKPLGILNIAVLLLSAISCFTFSEDFLQIAMSMLQYYLDFIICFMLERLWH